MSQDPSSPERRGWRLFLFFFAALVVVGLWVAMGAAWFLDAPRTVFISLVVAVAVASEGLFWLGAVLLGWSAFANRKKIWARLTGKKLQDTTS